MAHGEYLLFLPSENERKAWREPPPEIYQGLYCAVMSSQFPMNTNPILRRQTRHSYRKDEQPAQEDEEEEEEGEREGEAEGEATGEGGYEGEHPKVRTAVQKIDPRVKTELIPRTFYELFVIREYLYERVHTPFAYPLPTQSAEEALNGGLLLAGAVLDPTHFAVWTLDHKNDAHAQRWKEEGEDKMALTEERMNKRAAKAVMEEDGVLLLHYEVNRRLLNFLSGSSHFEEYYHRRTRKEKPEDKKKKWWKLLKERFGVLWTDLKAVERESGSEISRKYDDWMVLRSPSLQQSVKHYLLQQRTEQTRGEDRDRNGGEEEGGECREEQHAWRELMQLWRDSVQNEVMLLQKKVKAVVKDIKQEGAKYTKDKKGKEVSAMMEELVEDIFRFRFGKEAKEETGKIDTKGWRELLTGSLFSTLDECIGRCLFLWEDSQQQSKKRQRQEWQRLKRCLNPVAVVDSCVACFRKKGFLLDKDFFLHVLRQECCLSNRNGKTEKEVAGEQEHEGGGGGAEEQMGDGNGEDVYILYRGTSSVDEDSTSWKTNHNPLGAHSLSFGSDSSAVPPHLQEEQSRLCSLPSEERLVSFTISSSSSFNELFYIPPLSCLVQLFAIGEVFHPRTRVSLPTTLDEEEGERRGGKRATFNERENNGIDGLLQAETEPKTRSRAAPPFGFVSGILNCAYTSLPMFLTTSLSPPSLETKWRATLHRLRVALPKENK
ncbi:hypothetical protein QOT17_017697 [Balamuthia mandrillaris]